MPTDHYIHEPPCECAIAEDCPVHTPFSVTEDGIPVLPQFKGYDHGDR